MEYIRISENYKNNKLIPITEDVFLHVNNKDTPWFTSMLKYNEEHYKLWKETGSLAGIRNNNTKHVWWDFDCEENIEAAKVDTQKLCNKLLSKGIKEENMQIAYSGKKGFGIIIDTLNELTVEQVKSICFKLAEDLPTFDKKMYDNQRIFRLPFTKNEKSGLYKIPITLQELNTCSIAQIKEFAKDISLYNIKETMGYYKPTTLPAELLSLEISPLKTPTKTLQNQHEAVSLSTKPKWMTNCKFHLMQGVFIPGHRNDSLTILAATLKSQGFNKDNIYSVLKSANRLHSQKGGEAVDKSEIWSIANSVTQPTWKGGTFSCRTIGILQDFCLSLGDNKCKHDEGSTISADDVFGLFNKYAESYEDNILYTGIQSLDERLKLMVGTSNGLLAPPSAGKTSMSLEILNHNSNQGINSLFFSYDMFHSALYIRMIQRHTGYDQDKIFDIFKNDKKEMRRIKELLKKEYNKVKFCFKAGQSIEELENTILDTQDKMGEKVKLVVVDYNELISTNMTDSTASSAQVAQKLRQIANEREVAILTLLQPSKLYSNPAEEISSFSNAKGSSSLAQSFTSMLGCSRPGFNPRGDTDKFFNITCLKNRNGPLFSLDYSWEGLTGKIHELTDEERHELKELREAKAAHKAANSSGWA